MSNFKGVVITFAKWACWKFAIVLLKDICNCDTLSRSARDAHLSMTSSVRAGTAASENVLPFGLRQVFCKAGVQAYRRAPPSIVKNRITFLGDLLY